MTVTAAVDEFKTRQRTVWSNGDYPTIAMQIQSAADDLVATAGVGQGTRVLDVATGTGNVAIPAAQAGAAVTGLDLTPELLAAAARRAEEAGVEIDWVEGDAEALPFEDGSFDCVLSTFGVMFAPRHEVAAAELVRVCKPGGLIGLCSWTPEGTVGEMFKVTSSFMGPAPDFASPPPLWGTEEHIRALLGDACELELERRNVTFEQASPEAYAEWFTPRFGPLVTAKQVLEPERYAELYDALLAMMRRNNESEDAYRVPGEYLRVLARVRS